MISASSHHFMVRVLTSNASRSFTCRHMLNLALSFLPSSIRCLHLENLMLTLSSHCANAFSILNNAPLPLTTANASSTHDDAFSTFRTGLPRFTCRLTCLVSLPNCPDVVNSFTTSCCRATLCHSLLLMHRPPAAIHSLSLTLSSLLHRRSLWLTALF